MKKTLTLISFWLLTWATWGTNFVDRVEVKKFINMMTESYQFDRAELEKIFGNFGSNQYVLDQIANPAEKLTWSKYRKLLLSKERIQAGKAFLKQHAKVLSRAEKTYGVPKQIIVAILGVESFYGARAGKIPVVEALATLAFDYPPRAKFFTNELVEFLLFTKEQQLDPLAITGSYAGAMWSPQFMPSSCRSYAVDFAGIGSARLDNLENAIGSIANYLAKNGWQSKKPIAVSANVFNTNLQSLVATGFKNLAPRKSFAELKTLGLRLRSDKINVTKELKASLVSLEEESKNSYWVVFENFYVITKYNRSINYAMSVTQLAALLQ